MRMTGNVSKGFADYLQVVQRRIVAGIQQIELVHSRFVEGFSRKHVCNRENGGFEFRKFIRLHAFFKTVPYPSLSVEKDEEYVLQ